MSGKINVAVAQRIVGYHSEEDASRKKLGTCTCWAEVCKKLGSQFAVTAGIVKASRLGNSSFRRARPSKAKIATWTEVTVERFSRAASAVSMMPLS